MRNPKKNILRNSVPRAVCVPAITRGFFLIELLVCIAISAIQAFMDLSPLAKAKHKARGIFGGKSIGKFVLVLTSLAEGFSTLSHAGAVDERFDLGRNWTQVQVYAHAVQPDGKVLVGGAFGVQSAADGGVDSSNSPGLIRLNADGSLDTGFKLDLLGRFPAPAGSTEVSRIFTQTDHGILVSLGCCPPAFVRLTLNGTLDQSFILPDAVAASYVSEVAVAGDGRIILGNAGTDGVIRLQRLKVNGELDPTFQENTLPEAYSLLNLSVQMDEKTLVAGNFREFAGAARTGIARLNTDGSLDTAFVPMLQFAAADGRGSVSAVYLQSDQRILIFGSFTTVNGVQRKGFARLNQDGSLDAVFAPIFGQEYVPWSGRLVGGRLAAEIDRRLFVAAPIDWSYNNDAAVVELRPDGSVNPDFDPVVLQECCQCPGVSWVISPHQNGLIASGLGLCSANFVERTGLARIALGDGPAPIGLRLRAGFHRPLDGSPFFALVGVGLEPGASYVLQGSGDLRTWGTVRTWGTEVEQWTGSATVSPLLVFDVPSNNSSIFFRLIRK